MFALCCALTYLLPGRSCAQVLDKCKRCRHCPHCGDYNGTVKKATGSLKIIHEKYAKNDALMNEYVVRPHGQACFCLIYSL